MLRICGYPIYILSCHAQRVQYSILGDKTQQGGRHFADGLLERKGQNEQKEESSAYKYCKFQQTTWHVYMLLSKYFLL